MQLDSFHDFQSGSLSSMIKVSQFRNVQLKVACQALHTCELIAAQVNDDPAVWPCPPISFVSDIVIPRIVAVPQSRVTPVWLSHYLDQL